MSAADFDPVFQSAGAQYGVDPAVLKALAAQESSFNPKAVNPDTGAAGIMQYIPASAKAIGLDPMDPVASINQAAKDFSGNMQRFNGNVEQAVAAHFAGPNQKLWGPKTNQYVSDVAQKYAAIRQSGGFAPAPDQPTPQQPAAPDNIDAMLAQRAQGQPAAAPSQQPSAPDPLDAMLAARAAGKQIPASAAGGTGAAAPQAAAGQPQPISAGARFAQGAMDPLNAGAQDLVHALPGGVVNAVNSATQYVNGLPVIGPITKALGMTPATPQQVDQNIAQNEQTYQARRAASGSNGIDWMRMAGNVAGTAPLAMAAPTMAGAGIGAQVGAGAALGAANGALTPVTNASPDQSFGAQKAQQVGLGALTGGVAAPLSNAVGSVISGAGGAAQRQLANAGVTMTPGQILGGGFARTEDKLTSVPVLGDLIKNAQQRSVQSFNKATYNEVLAPLGQKYSGPVGNEGVQAVQNTISNAYDSALSRMKFNAADPQFQSDISNLAGLAQGLPPAQQQTFSNVLKTQIFGKLSPQGQMDGQTLKGVQSELSRIARGYTGDPSFDNRQLGQAIGEIKNAIDSSLPRYNPPDAVKDLANANAAYANFVRLRGAAASQGAMNNGGVFTAAQLQNAVKGADKSVGKGATATGNALMQDLSSAGQSVLGSKYPDSGTAGRSILGLAAGAMAGHAFLPPGAIAPAALGLGAAALPYTAPGQRLAQALLMSRPAGAQAVGQAVNRFAVPLAPALGNALLNGPNH